MSEIFDAIARISWDSNIKELRAVTDEMRSQDKVLDELRRKGARLEDQIRRTNDPAKLARYNNELQETKRRADAIVATQKKQVEITDQLRKKQSELHQELRKNNDPKLVQGLLQNLGRVENQLDSITAKSKVGGGIGSKIGGLGSSLMLGLGIGGGVELAMTTINAVKNFLANSKQEFEDAERSAIELERTLTNIGRGNLLMGLQNEAERLSEQFGGLFDNDDIIKAQTALVQYGKVSRDEMSKLLPVIMELSSAQRVDLATATQTVINILEGRGGQTLRDYGVSVKGVKTEHDRLNVVLGDFSNKLKGASDAYAQTAEGIEQKNRILMANVEERFGASVNKLRLKILPILTKFLNVINLGTMSEDEITDEKIKIRQKGFAAQLAGANEEQLKEYEQTAKRYAKAAFEWKRNLDKLRENGSAAYGRREFLAREKQYTREMERNAEIAQALNYAISNERAMNQSGKGPLNKNADLTEETVKEVKKTNQELKKPENKIKINVSFVESGPGGEEKPSSGGNSLVEILNRLMPAVQEFKRETEKLNNEIQDARIQAKLDEIDARDARKKTDEEERARQKQLNAEYRQELYDNVLAAVDSVQMIIAVEQNKNDRLIQLQQERIDKIRDSQEKGSKESLKVEEDRLNELLAKRKWYEQQQRVIDAAVIAANQALAISGAISTIANSKNPVLIAANVLAILAGIGATVAGIKGAFQDDTGFFVGGYTGDGDPKQTSTAVGRRPYKYHKGEFVMDHNLTAKHRDLFDGLHKRELLVQKMNDGYYIGPKVLDTERAIQDYYTAKSFNMDSTGIISEIQHTNKLLKRGRVVVENNFDVHGFSTSLASQITQTELRRKMTKLG